MTFPQPKEGSRKEAKMKSWRFIILIVVLTEIGLIGMTIPGFGQEKVKQEGPPKEAMGFTIARLAVGTGIENREPVGISEKFPSSIERVYCFLEAIDITKDTEVSFGWVHEGNEMRKITLPLKTGQRWRTYAFKNLAGLKGSWKVEIKDSVGKLLGDIQFKVE